MGEPNDKLTDASKSKEYYHTLKDAAPIGIFAINLQGETTYANPHCLAMLELTFEEYVGDGWVDRVHPSERERIAQAWRKAIAECQPYSQIERFVRKNGESFWIDVRTAILHDAEGQPTGQVGIIEDITARVLAETKLQDQAQLLDNVREAIIVITMDRVITYWNKGAEEIYGWKANEIIGQTEHSFLYGTEEEIQTICNALHDRLEWEGEIQQTTKDGRQILVSKRASLIFDDLGQPKYIFSINRDITERKRREAQSLRVQRLESIGTLAGGIAHDLNNILTPILLSIDLLKDLVTDENGLKVLEAMQLSAERGSDLVKQVLTFSRSDENASIEMQPFPFLKKIVRMARETFPRDIAVVFKEDPDLWKVRGDPTQLEQAFLNLCVNARDAMPGGGLLTINAKNVPAAKDDKPHIAISFIDTGEGIVQRNLDRIFDPFFTTRPFGKGTGLGLSTAQSIIRNHGGAITVQSEYGKGAHFQILLPAIVQDAPTKSGADSAGYIQGKGETILLVDDEPSVREVARRTLEAFGYQTLVAADGAEAVEIYRAQKDKIDLVFTDIMMPILDGIDASKAMFALNPHVKIIAASGLSSREDLPEPLASRLKHFLNKPYATKTLLQVLRQTLEE